ncbi:MAG: RES family NAD+ phosphorylase [Burkholderiaceae bacterium]|nr:RES family NAD+ phosphorylase [Burkholderiaceae bacterium]
MIVTPLNTVAYRVHQPKWSFAPASGAGAGMYGGRANRPGVNALYLSLELETALAEYQQLDALMPPGLMVSYNVSVDAVVDFRGGYTSDWDPLWQDFYCDWRNIYFNQGIEPPSWVIGDQVLTAGAKGILFNSAITARANLVIYTDALAGADAVAVHDPDNALPKNQQSWE